MHEIKILDQDDETITLGGFAVVFDGRDLEGDTFTKDTDFMLDNFADNQPVMIDHTQPVIVEHNGKTFKLTGVPMKVGHVIEVTPQDVGLYVKLLIEKAGNYWGIVDGMMSTKRLGLSSGSVSHLVRKDGGVIKTWPIAEVSLTLTPAEPRTAVLGVEPIKIVYEDGDLIKGIIKAAGNAADDADSEATILDSGELTMSNEEQEVKEEEVQDEEASTVDNIVDYSKFVDEIKALRLDIEKISKPVNKITTTHIKTTKTAANENPVVKANADYANWVRNGGNGRYQLELFGNEVKAPAKYAWGFDADGKQTKAINITTPTEGQEAVPIGHHREIIQQMEEIGPLYQRLGVRNIPGKGTTVNVPTQAAGAGLMTPAATESATAVDNDPVFAQVAMTLLSYRTKVAVTYEILNDEDSMLLSFLSGFAARAMVNTHNSLLNAEVAANGTSYGTTAANTGFAAGEIEAVAGNDTLAPYIDDQGMTWVMRNSTHMNILSIDGNRFYADDTAGGMVGTRNRMLLDYPVTRSNFVPAIATTAKTVLLGNWAFLAVRHAPTFTVLRDPYSRAENGEVVFHYFMRTVYAVLQADAVGYIEMAI